MPTYQYTCTRCGQDLEARQSFSDAALTDCPSCGTGNTLRKQFSAVGVVFKGSGFYRNDSRSGSSKEASKDTGTKSTGKTETKSESKSETKTDTKKADKPQKAAAKS